MGPNIAVVLCLALLGLFLVVDSRSYHGRVKRLERLAHSLEEDVQQLKQDNLSIRQALNNLTESLSTSTKAVKKHNACAYNQHHRANSFWVRRKRNSFDSKTRYNVSFSYLVDKNDPSLISFSYWSYYSQKHGYSPLKRNYPTHLNNNSEAMDYVDVKPERDSHVTFVFGTERIWYAVQLNNSLKYTTEMNLQLPEMYTFPDDIVVDPYQNKSTQLVVSNDIKLPNDFSLSERIIYDRLSSKFISDWYPPQPLSSQVSYGANGSCGTNRTVVNLNWQHVSLSLSGVITVMAERNFNNNMPVKSVQVYKKIIFRPYNQSGPFPRDVFEFQPSVTEKELSPGKFVHYCKTNESCSIECIAVGSNFTEMTIMDKQGILNRENVTSALYITHIVAKVTTKRSRKIICIATNPKFVTIRRSIDLKYMSRPSRPKLNVYYNETNRRWTAECKSRGVPKPEITIINNNQATYNGSLISGDGFENLYNVSSIYEDGFENLSNSTKMSKIRTTIRTDDVKGTISVSCKARNDMGTKQVSKTVKNDRLN